MSVSTSQILVLAVIGLLLLNIGYVKRASRAGMVMLCLGVICMVLVISGGVYVGLHGGAATF